MNSEEFVEKVEENLEIVHDLRTSIISTKIKIMDNGLKVVNFYDGSKNYDDYGIIDFPVLSEDIEDNVPDSNKKDEVVENLKDIYQKKDIVSTISDDQLCIGYCPSLYRRLIISDDQLYTEYCPRLYRRLIISEEKYNNFEEDYIKFLNAEVEWDSYIRKFMKNNEIRFTNDYTQIEKVQQNDEKVLKVMNDVKQRQKERDRKYSKINNKIKKYYSEAIVYSSLTKN